MTSPEFPGNSKRTPAAAEPKKIEQVVRTEATSVQKPLGRRLKEMFIGGDSRTVMQYVITEVLLPQAKDMVNEAIAQGFERLIFGDGRTNRSSGNRLGSNTHTNYRQYAGRGNNPIGRSIREERPPPSVQIKNVNDIICPTVVEAETVLNRMGDLLEEYGSVSLADLYALIGWSSTHTDNKWGWESLEHAGIRRIHTGKTRGYALDLPNTIALP